MESISHWPIVILLIGIITVVVLIVVFKIHAFLSLLFAATVVGILTPELPEEGANHFVAAVEMSMTAFGEVAGKIAFVIALASILGIALTASGAAERIVNVFINVLGERLAPIALLISGFVLSIPVFFDTVFFLLIPIGYSMGIKLKKNYVLFVLAISAGAAITHHLVPPTPGPLLMAEDLQINLGLAIVAGLLCGLVPAGLAYWYSIRLSRKMDIKPPTFDEGGTLSEEQLPSFNVSILPIAVPILLIIVASASEYLYASEDNTGFKTFVNFIGNKNVAMLIGTIIALWLLAKQKGWTLKQVSKSIEKPLEVAGIIILITSAGGAFGGMIKHSGIGGWIEELALNGLQINYILLAWIVAAVMKIAQGSGTVSMITSAGIMAALLQGVDLPYHPVYIYMAIGFGAMFITWMNDSGFWVISKLAGFTEKQTLQTWTVVLGLIGLSGLIQTLIISRIFPLV